MSDTQNTRKEGPGVLAWRTIYTAGIAVLGILSYRLLISLDATTEAVNRLNIELSSFMSSTTVELKDHDRRLGRLEDWRNGGPR